MKLQAPSLAFLRTLIGGGSEVTDTRGWNLSRLYLETLLVFHSGLFLAVNVRDYLTLAHNRFTEVIFAISLSVMRL